MSGAVQRAAFRLPVQPAQVHADWEREGFSFGVFRDPPGQRWDDFVHQTDEYVLIAEGRLVVEVGAERFLVEPGDLIRIPRGVRHSLHTLSKEGSVWFYGYGYWADGGEHG